MYCLIDLQEFFAKLLMHPRTIFRNNIRSYLGDLIKFLIMHPLIFSKKKVVVQVALLILKYCAFMPPGLSRTHQSHLTKTNHII